MQCPVADMYDRIQEDDQRFIGVQQEDVYRDDMLRQFECYMYEWQSNATVLVGA